MQNLDSYRNSSFLTATRDQFRQDSYFGLVLLVSVFFFFLRTDMAISLARFLWSNTEINGKQSTSFVKKLSHPTGNFVRFADLHQFVT